MRAIRVASFALIGTAALAIGTPAAADDDGNDMTSFDFTASPATVAPGGTVTLHATECEAPAVTASSGVFKTVTLNEGRPATTKIAADAKPDAKYDVTFVCKGEKGTTPLTVTGSSGSHTGTETGADAGTATGTGTDTGTGADTGTGTGADSTEMSTGADAGTEMSTGTDAGTDTEMSTEADTGTGSDAGTTTGTGADTPEMSTGTDTGTGTAKPDAGTGTAAKPDAGTGTAKPDAGTGTAKPDRGSGNGKPDRGSGNGKPDRGSGNGKPDGGVKGGAGGSVSDLSPAQIALGSALLAGALGGSVALLRRRAGDSVRV
ncbi:hypothetical protein ABT010_05135 [Streptomyces sp. NPDC002668]|uniref:hypothetical protein n=1 Tax=Streptomyces sp. NPDC002668 TaxID=3154422 RepID=UPI00332B1909